MCNFARDVPAGVHVHDYRKTGEREGAGGRGEEGGRVEGGRGREGEGGREKVREGGTG